MIKLLKVLFAVALVSVGAFTASAQVPSFINKSGVMFTNSVLVATTNTTITTVTSNNAAITPIALLEGAGFSIAPYILGTNANSTNTITFYFDVANDVSGTNFSTTHPFSYTMVAAGTNVARGYTNFGHASLENATAIKLGAYNYTQTNLGSIVISNITWGYTFSPNSPYKP